MDAFQLKCLKYDETHTYVNGANLVSRRFVCLVLDDDVAGRNGAPRADDCVRVIKFILYTWGGTINFCDLLGSWAHVVWERVPDCSEGNEESLEYSETILRSPVHHDGTLWLSNAPTTGAPTGSSWLIRSFSFAK